MYEFGFTFVVARGFRFGSVFGFRLTGDRKAQPHPGAALIRSDRRSIVKFDPAAVVFQNTADDRKPEPGALLARGHVRLEQPRPRDLRQPDAVVDDVDDHVVAVA